MYPKWDNNNMHTPKSFKPYQALEMCLEIENDNMRYENWKDKIASKHMI